MAKITINIEGYGRVKIKRPKELNNETFANSIAETTTQVMNLIAPRTQSKRFHPVLGIGGYENRD
jgi:hypothetical protein